MDQYALKLNPKKSAKVYGRALRISTKSSVTVCKAISKKNLQKGKILLQDIMLKKRSLNGKYYTNTTKEILSLLGSAEANAEFKGLDTSRMIIYASAHKGFGFMRPRRLKLRGMRRKMTNVQVVLIQK